MLSPLCCICFDVKPQVRSLFCSHAGVMLSVVSIHFTGLQQASEGGRFDSGNLPGVTQHLRKLVIHNLSRCIGQTEPKSRLTKSIANHGMQSRSRSKVSLRKGVPIMAELFSKRKTSGFLYVQSESPFPLSVPTLRTLHLAPRQARSLQRLRSPQSL